jgi:Protein of unknown function (DUF2786)
VTTPESDEDRQRRIADKVEKLFLLAVDPRTPDEERQAAYAKAADLMTRHNIDQAMVRSRTGHAPEPVEAYRYEVPNTGKHGKARTFAAGSIAEALGCKCAYFYFGPRSTCHIMIVGIASDVATVRTLLPLVMTQAEHAAGPAARTHLAHLREHLTQAWQPASTINTEIRRERTNFYRSFIQAYASAVAARIRERRQSMVAEAVSTGTGADLVLVDRDQRVVAEFGQMYPKLRAARRPPCRPRRRAPKRRWPRRPAGRLTGPRGPPHSASEAVPVLPSSSECARILDIGWESNPAGQPPKTYRRGGPRCLGT